MLTIFSIPKPFAGHVAVIQRNAINSWYRLHPKCEMILFGDEVGTKETAAELNARYVPNITRNEYGTPLLDAIFAQAQQIASHRLICYVNADIILLSEFLEAVKRISFRRFLAAGQRWDVDLAEHWDFEHKDWEERLRRYVAAKGVLHPPWGLDYFVFPRDCSFGELPPFAVGRPGWDNWMIFRARKLGMPVVDIGRAVMVIHQNHAYGHVPEGKGETWEGPEADRNRELLGGQKQSFNLLDATHVMMSRAILPALGYKHLRRRWQTLPILIPRTRPLLRLLKVERGVFCSIARVLFCKIRRWMTSNN